jgi:hypothetical protein
MPTKRQRQLAMLHCKPYIDRDYLTIAEIIVKEFQIASDEMPEGYADKILNIANQAYAMGMLSGIDIAEDNAKKLNKLITPN